MKSSLYFIFSMVCMFDVVQYEVEERKRGGEGRCFVRKTRVIWGARNLGGGCQSRGKILAANVPPLSLS